MDTYAILQSLVDLAESLGIEVRRGPIAGPASDEHVGGALVRLKGREILFLDTQAPLADQVAAAAGALSGRQELQEMFLPPEIRQTIDTIDSPEQK